jgi:hypothetical protein
VCQRDKAKTLDERCDTCLYNQIDCFVFALSIFDGRARQRHAQPFIINGAKLRPSAGLQTTSLCRYPTAIYYGIVFFQQQLESELTFSKEKIDTAVGVRNIRHSDRFL